MITYHKGDVLAITERPLLIAHIVNDRGLFNAGVAKQIRDKYLWAYESYFRGGMRCGEVIIARNAGLSIAHLCAMDGVRSNVNPTPLIMPKLNECLYYLGGYAKAHGYPFVAMPKIGAGLAGGNWTDISLMIGHVFSRHGVEARIYEL